MRLITLLCIFLVPAIGFAQNTNSEAGHPNLQAILKDQDADFYVNNVKIAPNLVYIRESSIENIEVLSAISSNTGTMRKVIKLGLKSTVRLSHLTDLVSAFGSGEAVKDIKFSIDGMSIASPEVLLIDPALINSIQILNNKSNGGRRCIIITRNDI